jgi:hypothetical protein
MTISKLVTGGQSFERPSVSAFFGKSPANANDNVEQVSSDFLNKDIFRSMIGSIDIIGKELNKLRDLSKNIMKSFENLIKNTRDLNRDITRRFRDVNEQLNQSRMDFLRSIMLTPVPASDKPTTIGNLVKESEKGAATTDTPPPPEEKKSFLDSMLDLASLAETAKDAFDLAKKYGPKVMQGARAFAGSAALPVTAVAGTLIALAYQRKQAQEADPLGAENFDRTIASGAKRAEVIQGPEADANAPNAGADISRQKLSPPDFLMREGIIKMPSEAKNVIASIKGNIITLKDGRWWDNTEQVLRDPASNPTMTGKAPAQQGAPTAANNIDPEIAKKAEMYKEMGKKGIPLPDNIAADPLHGKLALTAWQEGQKESQGAPTAGAAADDRLDETEAKHKRIAGLAAKNGLNPANVTAQLEGGVPTSITSDGKTIDVYNDLTDDEKEKVNMARKLRADVQSGGKQITENAGASATTPPAAPAGGGTEGAGGPEQKQQQQAPVAPSGGTEGAGTPEKAPSGGGAGTGGGESAAGTPTAAPAPAPTAAAPTGGGESTGTPAATTMPSAPAATATAGSAEGMTGSPSGTGTPEAAPPAPSTPPAPPPTPEASAGDAGPIVMSNSSTQNIGSSTPGETSVMSGQNLPMNAQNDKIKEYLAKQTMEYQ